MKKSVVYPVEVKETAIQMNLLGKITREIMDVLNIRSKTQVKTR